MKRSLRKLLWLVSGILLIFAGIIAIFHPQSAVLSVSFVLGVALLFSGIFSAIIFLTAKGTAFGSAWVLAGGLFDIILACMMLGNPYLVEENLPFSCSARCISNPSVAHNELVIFVAWSDFLSWDKHTRKYSIFSRC